MEKLSTEKGDVHVHVQRNSLPLGIGFKLIIHSNGALGLWSEQDVSEFQFHYYRFALEFTMKLCTELSWMENNQNYKLYYIDYKYQK